jgi:signal transduction histidine kinase/DNA-binding response OmpR family regulator
VNSLPFRWKLTLLILLVCTISLGVSFVGFYIYDGIRVRDELDRRVDSAKRLVLDRAVVAIEANADKPDIHIEFLEKEAEIVAAAIYGPDGRLLAKYIKTGTTEYIPPPQRFSSLFNTDRTVVLTPIRNKDQRVLGTLFIKADLNAVKDARVGNLVRGAGGILLISTLFALIVAYFLQGRISKPITLLATAARDVAAKQDFSVRVPQTSTDEIGTLIASFNSMLATIQQRSADLETAKLSLEDANKTLEKKVHERTAELGSALMTAREASHAKSSFLAKMSHELRTPLNAIIGYSELLSEDSNDDGVKDDLNKILSAARHLLGLINDVLDLSKIEAGKMDLYIEPLDLWTIVQEIAGIVTPLYEKRNNTLTVECSDSIGVVHADATKLRQILLNLLSNAAKFTEAGRVVIKVSRGPLAGEDWIQIDVSDTGIGITDEQMSRLFQAFTQADASTSSKYGGTGLGLAICRQFARIMGGEVGVTSKPGQGSTFTLRMPARVRRPKTTYSGAPLSNSSPTATTPAKLSQDILVIDEDESVQRALGKILEPEGFTVISARTGKDGLRLAREKHPRLIILDILMPDMDGWTVLKELKQHPAIAAIPVVLLTMTDDKETGFALGASAFINKPIEQEQLLEAIQHHKASADGRHALVVEDDPHQRDLVLRMLEKEGWESEFVVNGAEALEAVATRQPAIILLDLLMAEMDGFEFLTHLRANPDWKLIPVVVITSMDLTSDVRARLQGRVDNIFQKGRYSRDNLIRQIRDSVGITTADRLTRSPFSNH